MHCFLCIEKMIAFIPRKIIYFYTNHLKYSIQLSSGFYSKKVRKQKHCGGKKKIKIISKAIGQKKWVKLCIFVCRNNELIDLKEKIFKVYLFINLSISIILSQITIYFKNMQEILFFSFCFRFSYQLCPHPKSIKWKRSEYASEVDSHQF